MATMENMYDESKRMSKKLKTDLPVVFLALKHGSTSVPAKVTAAVTVCYALSPVDPVSYTHLSHT